MEKLGWLACPLQFFQPLGLPVLELLHRIDTDAEFDEMERHSWLRFLQVIVVPSSYPASFGYPTGASSISPPKITAA